MDSPFDLDFDYQPELPVAISQVGGRYLVFDVKVATYLRREHSICGVTLGTLPLAPSQNLFLGVPIELMIEEAQLLVERGVAIVVDDARAHDHTVRSSESRARRADYLARLETQSQAVKLAKDQEKEQSRRRGLEKQAKKSGSSSTSAHDHRTADLLDFGDDETAQKDAGKESTAAADDGVVNQDDSPINAMPVVATANTYQVTPATSRLLLPPTSSLPESPVQGLPPSYPLYRHLHDQGFFMTPGLRFGCQYTVYPGDPLRFHSHFLAVGTQWDEELDLMDLVGGGRLGTGVKKGFLLGGASPAGDVRTFSVEWAAM